MRRAAALALLAFYTATAALGQQSNYVPAQPVAGISEPRLSAITPVSIPSAYTFVLVLPAVSTTVRQALWVQNNNASNTYCFLAFTASNPTTQTSMLLNSGSTQQWQWPLIPADALSAACSTSNASLFVGTE